ncbi:Propanediol diffusion facilitator [Actinomadura rubteroloni]|uniref:Propanediol diffusion facilitator n=1 Tax=Actinomadura rubteroloni TaxID=1926885 RepID=A0A2P4URG8_9ACTN|nr:aquaporin [Actinomadura rubteroloni]POM27643.1 Propanediol diffusion facilitator [Actinomadura rubteroloni]
MTLARRAFAEALGTGLLVTVVVGSGIMAQRLSDDTGLRLLENSVATAAGLAVLILLLGPVSGAHFNPVITLVDWALSRHADGRTVAVYLLAQTGGAIGGAVLADLMFGLPAVTIAAHHRTGADLWLGEVVATAGLVALVFALARQGRAAAAPAAAPAAVGAYIGAAYWFTSSTSFANPAVTVGRAFTDTFAGIAPSSVPGFVAAQFVGGALGAVLVLTLYPTGESRARRS